MISGRILREARLRVGLSRVELAARTGKAVSAIGRWERGEVEPSLETLRDLVRSTGLELTFGVTVGDDHDVALIRRSLAHDPVQRLEDLVTAVAAVAAMAGAARG